MTYSQFLFPKAMFGAPPTKQKHSNADKSIVVSFSLFQKNSGTPQTKLVRDKMDGLLKF